jgi:hypothetical protein
VNFFGHATVACWFEHEPHFVFGAMLPDLAAMLRLRPPTSTLPAITHGIVLHHATDAAFHGTPAFVALVLQAREALLLRELPRGPARALAHVGTEILLDENLGAEPDVESAYLNALDVAASAPLAWPDPRGRDSLADLAKNLRARGVARSHPPELVARRLNRALESHPRLAFDSAHEPRVADFVQSFRPLVAASAELIVSQLKQRLATSLRESPHAFPHSL